MYSTLLFYLRCFSLHSVPYVYFFSHIISLFFSVIFAFYSSHIISFFVITDSGLYIQRWFPFPIVRSLFSSLRFISVFQSDLCFLFLPDYILFTILDYLSLFHLFYARCLFILSCLCCLTCILACFFPVWYLFTVSCIYIFTLLQRFSKLQVLEVTDS